MSSEVTKPGLDTNVKATFAGGYNSQHKGGSMSATYKAIQVTTPGEFATVMKPLVDPGPGQERIRVEASGVCH